MKNYIDYKLNKLTRFYGKLVYKKWIDDGYFSGNGVSIKDDGSGYNLIRYIASVDPTSKKRFTEWLIKIYLIGYFDNIFTMDEKAYETLVEYNKFKEKGILDDYDKNIYSFISPTDLWKKLEFYKHKTQIKYHIGNEEQRFLDNNEAQITYNDGEIFVVKITDSIDAFSAFSYGTEWSFVSAALALPNHKYTKTQNKLLYFECYIVIDSNIKKKYFFLERHPEPINEHNSVIDYHYFCYYYNIIQHILTNITNIHYEIYHEKDFTLIKILNQKTNSITFFVLDEVNQNFNVLDLYNDSLFANSDEKTSFYEDWILKNPRIFNKALNIYRSYYDVPLQLKVKMDKNNRDLTNILPEYYETSYELYLSELGITKLPKGLYTEDDLILDFNELTEIPDDLTVLNILDLSGNPLEKINNRLYPGMYLFLDSTLVKEIPKNIKVVEMLSADYSLIEKIPWHINKNNDKNFELSLINTPVKEIEEGSKFYGSIDLYGSQLNKIHKNVEIYGSLYISNTNITELPDNLYVENNLFACGVNIDDIPNNLYVGGCFFISNTPLRGKYWLHEIEEIIRDRGGYINDDREI